MQRIPCTSPDISLYVLFKSSAKASKSSTAQLILNLKDVNDNPPILAKESVFFCHPLQGGETAKIEVSDPDERSFTHLFSYTLLGDNVVQANWDVSKPDGKFLRRLIQIQPTYCTEFSNQNTAPQPS